jgi:hypothetical protein
MNRFKIVLGMLFIITTITITILPILINEDKNNVRAQPGVIPIDPENVTNQTLQGYPSEDKDMSTGIENE